MSKSISEIISNLQADKWRAKVGFTPEIQAAHDILFDSRTTESDCFKLLGHWLQKHQPCLFGRIAARQGLISYCILNESELLESDEAIKERIQTHRSQWTRDSFEGKKSGFIILLISPTIARALPNENMKALARRLCSLYLLTDVFHDEIYLDEVFLEKPGRRRTTWQWYAGVNYFSSQGDKRWWQDHRIPGGLAFSMNSVGHMVKSSKLAAALNQLDKLMEAPEEEEGVPSKVDSLETALDFAMRTINMASESVSGTATSLMPLPSDLSQLPVRECPVELPEFLRDKNFCNYLGYYHTDYTIPSEYFLPDVERPSDLKGHTLDFTYLFDKSPENPAFQTMGTGRQIRGGKKKASAVSGETAKKRIKASAKSVRISSHPRLVKALKG